MDIIKKNLTDLKLNQQVFGDFKKHIPGKRPFKMENKKTWFGNQEIHIIGREYKGVKEFPSELIGTSAEDVVNVLDRVWLDKGEVSEGIISDLVYGCRYDVVTKMPYEKSRIAINELRQKGYIEFSDSEGNIGEQAWRNLEISQIWFRFTEKFTNFLIMTPV